jgi:gluconate 2-dehydrogenase subunit 3-like protein
MRLAERMPDAEPLLTWSRRSFLRYTAVSAGLLALSRLRVAPALAAAPVSPQLQVLTAREADILTAIVERMVLNGDPSMPAVRETHAIAVIDQTLLQLDSSLQSQLRWLLTVFEWGPPLLQLKLQRFTNLSLEERDDYIRDWATSRFETRQLAFRALKNLSMLGYYSQDAAWKGIHYDGPWAPKAKKMLSAEW